MTEKEAKLKELKDKSEEKGVYISSIVAMGLIVSGLVYTLHDTKTGIAILASSLVPLLTKPELFSGNSKKIKELENEIEQSKQKTL